MRPQIVKVAVAVAIWSSVVGRSAWGDVRYTVTDLGTLPGYSGYSCANSINNNGQVVGYSSRSGDGNPHAFLWQRDTGMQDLGTLGRTPANTVAMALDINNCGQIVGYASSGVAYPSDPQGRNTHAFLWQNGSRMRDILNDGGWRSFASAINDNGQVTGIYRALDCDGDPSDPHAFLWQNGTRQIFAPWFEPSGINNAGQVVGSIGRAGQSGAYIWQSSTGLQNIGILPGDKNVTTTRINDKGQVVGYSSSAAGFNHAFLWQQDSGFQDLGSLGGGGPNVPNWALDINNIGQVVGMSNQSAFLWESGTGMVDLNGHIDPSSGWKLSSAKGINDNGWIVGLGFNPSGQARAFLLTPVPEPSGLVLIGIAGVSLVYARRRRQAA